MNEQYRSMKELEASLPKKEEVAKNLGINLDNQYNGQLKSLDAGRIGGVIGGEKVKRMIRMAQEMMADKDKN